MKRHTMKQRITPPLMLATVACSLALNTAWAACNSAITPTAPASDFSLNGDGTATHNATGLIWMRCSLGYDWDSNSSACTAGAGATTTYTWSAALTAAEATNFAGHSDWRLPNIKELTSIVEYACYSPAIDETVFPDTQSDYYWSSSPYADYSKGGWLLDVYYGTASDYLKSSGFSVRLVRGQ